MFMRRLIFEKIWIFFLLGKFTIYANEAKQANMMT